MSTTKIKRECFHPNEVPPDKTDPIDEAKGLAWYYWIFPIMTLLMVVALIFGVAGMIVYETGQSRGYRQGFKNGFNNGVDNAVFEMGRSGRCMAGYLSGDDETK